MNAATTEDWDDSQDPRNEEIAVESIVTSEAKEDIVIFYGDAEIESGEPVDDWIEAEPDAVVQRGQLR